MYGRSHSMPHLRHWARTIQAHGLRVKGPEGASGKWSYNGAVSVLQFNTPLAVDNNSGKGPWKLEGRPGFIHVSKLTKLLVNRIFPGSKADVDSAPFKTVNSELNLADSGQARCHVQSWEIIRKHTQNFLNGILATNDYKKFVESLYMDASGRIDTNDDWFQEMKQSYETVIADVDKKKLPAVTTVSELLRHLNSSPNNLRIDNSTMNSAIQGHLDLVVREIQSRAYRLSPRTRYLLRETSRLQGIEARVELTNGVLFLYTSSEHAPVAVAALTPDSQQRVKDAHSGVVSQIPPNFPLLPPAMQPSFFSRFTGAVYRALQRFPRKRGRDET